MHRAGYDHYRWYPNVDPDFDELGGELTLQQIADPLPVCEGEAWEYLPYRRAKERARYQARLLKQAEQADALRAVKQAAHRQIREAWARLDALKVRYHAGARYLNHMCRGCIPYNGCNSPPEYWSSVRAPFKVEDFLK